MSEQPGGLVVLHVDGLGDDDLQRAVADGRMPAVARLIREEGYTALHYRCGIPSTTPFAQAGILYGDNREIPSFRWFDRDAGAVIGFGSGSTFKQVAHKYFGGTRPLCEEGACIAACYPGGADETFGLAYRDRQYSGSRANRSALNVVAPWLANPAHLADLLGLGAIAAAGLIANAVEERAAGRHPVRGYVINDIFEEVVLHHLTRYAVRQAMDEGYPSIYAAFYAYDETGHAFGPEDAYTEHMLAHVDHSVRAVAEHRRKNRAGRDYRLVVLSDHGQIPTEPFNARDGVHLGELVAQWLPGCRVEEHKGKAFGPKDVPQTRVLLTYSGGLGHLYFAAFPDRLPLPEVRRRFPGLVEKLAGLDRLAFVLGRDRGVNVAVTAAGDLRWGAEDAGEARDLLARFDDPDVLARQLDRLNSFGHAGDLVLFGAWDGRREINLENQSGGHGSIGGAQAHPFLLVNEEWGVDTEHVEGAHQLHPILMDLRRRFTGR
ncbi:MAG: alkaline phosphatase family protein [Chloroflexota bacterium]